MKIWELMERKVASCAPTDSLILPARIMWERDCGCVPVVDRNNLVVGMITDRDVCMAAYTQGRSLDVIRVQDAMATPVVSCAPADDLATAEDLMRDNRVRRLPVCEADGTLAGVISLSDIAMESERERRESEPRLIRSTQVAEILGAVSKPRAHAMSTTTFGPEVGEEEFKPEPPIKRGPSYR
jgi:CBS domain-containing protein